MNSMRGTSSRNHSRSRSAISIAAMLLALTGVARSAAAEPLVNEAIINAPVAEVWRMFTTKEGMESWMVAQADIDLRVGGLIRTRYEAGGTLGDDQTIINQILSFDPERMLSMKVHRPPANFQFRNVVDGMWTVIYFQPLGADMTNVRVVGLGFRDDEESKKLREFFARGNAWTLEQLQKKYWPTCALCKREKLPDETMQKAIDESMSEDPAPEKK